jgi:hypothetical protein
VKSAPLVRSHESFVIAAATGDASGAALDAPSMRDQSRAMDDHDDKAEPNEPPGYPRHAQSWRDAHGHGSEVGEQTDQAQGEGNTTDHLCRKIVRWQ